MESAVIFFVSLCITLGTSTIPVSETVVPSSTHVKSINIPYRAPVHVIGYAPATTILEAPVLKAHSYATEIRHQVPVAVGAVPAPVKSTALVPAVGPVKSSVVPFATEIRHEVPEVAAHPKVVNVAAVDVAAPVVPVEVAPGPVVVPAEGPVKSSAIKAFSFATEVKHEVPVAAAPVRVHSPVAVAPAITEPLVKSIHAPAVAPQVLAQVSALAPESITSVEVAPIPAAVPVAGPVKSSEVKAFSFASEVKHQVPVAATPVAAPVLTEPLVKSIHAPAISTHVVAPAPAVGPIVKSIDAPVLAPKLITHAQDAAPLISVPAITPAEGPVKSSAIKAFSYATEVRHDVPVVSERIVQAPVINAPAISQPLVKSIHTPVSITETVPHAPAIAPVAKSIHAPVIAPQVVNNIPVVAPVVNSIHAPAITPQAFPHAPAVARIPKFSSGPAIGPQVLTPGIVSAVKKPVVNSHTTEIRYGTPFAARFHAPVLSAAGILGTGYPHRAQLIQRIPVNVNINRGIYGGVYGSYPRLYASLAAPGAALWRGHPVSSGITYLGGISRGAFGYHPIPVHYQGYRSPVHGVWNYFRGQFYK